MRRLTVVSASQGSRSRQPPHQLLNEKQLQSMADTLRVREEGVVLEFQNEIFQDVSGKYNSLLSLNQ